MEVIFDKLVWREDRVLLDDLVFRIEDCKTDTWELGDDCFLFYKTKDLVDQYERFWSTAPSFRPQSIFELGMWDGGSVAFWFELFQPLKHVGLDLSDRSDSRYFSQYVESRGLHEKIKTYWRTDQSDGPRLRQIAEENFSSPLDLVIDDASHIYAPTKASFEALFPLLRPGGFYIIEDWSWAHWALPSDRPATPAEARQERDIRNLLQIKGSEVTRLTSEIIACAGSSEELVSSVSVFKGFVAVERGPIDRSKLDGFRLQDHITHCKRPPLTSKLRPRLGIRRRLRRLLGDP